MFFEKRKHVFVGRIAELFLLSDIVHGFSTRKGGVSSPPFDSLNMGRATSDLTENVRENHERFFSQLNINIDKTAIPKQTHSDHIAIVETSGIYPDTDALISDTAGVPLVIQVADCLPVYLFDPVKKTIGLIHAGWRGSALEITKKTALKLAETYGSNTRDMMAFLGPSIGPCCYKVGDEVIQSFPAKYIVGNHLNLWHINSDHLLSAGLQKENIHISGLCTCCLFEWFFSHRLSGGITGRMMAVLGLV